MQRAADPRRAARGVLGATELITELARQRPQAPMTELNRPLSPNRRYAMRTAPLAAVKAAGKAAGGTINDTILAVVAGALAGVPRRRRRGRSRSSRSRVRADGGRPGQRQPHLDGLRRAADRRGATWRNASGASTPT